MVYIDRALRVAVLISVGAHIIVMSLVSIVTPEDMFRSAPYTKIDFLGSILDKTMFEIMMDDAGPAGPGFYSDNGIGREEEYLEVSAARLVSSRSDPDDAAGGGPGIRGIQAFEEAKPVPSVTLDFLREDFSPEGWMEGIGESASDAREAVYKPDPPIVLPGLFGHGDEFVVRVEILVSPRGAVLKAEPVTTSGYAEIDMTAVEYARGWIFEASGEDPGRDEWIELEIRLGAEE